MLLTYLFNGFLESGKSTFINDSLQQEYFQIADTTLLISCEEGEVEYDQEQLKSFNTVVEYIEDEDDFTVEKLQELEQKHGAKRILIEYNGMWDMRKIALPSHWDLNQQITLINAETFELYYNNMRSLMMEMLKNSELVLINRCDEYEDKLATFKRNVQLASLQSTIVFAGEEGELQVSLEEELPYDLQSDLIVLDDHAYVIFCMDCIDYAHRYIGKQLQFVAQVYKEKNMPKKYMMLGRQVMTCCADDLSFFGYPALTSQAPNFNDQEWVEVTVTFTLKKCFAYHNKGPVLEVVKINRIDPPLKPVIE